MHLQTGKITDVLLPDPAAEEWRGSSGLTPKLGGINPLNNNPKLLAWWGWNYISYRVFSMSPLITIIFTSNAKGLLGIEP